MCFLIHCLNSQTYLEETAINSRLLQSPNKLSSASSRLRFRPKDKILNIDEVQNMPRERHYLLGHEAFRQMCEHDPYQFFERMVAPDAIHFISELIKQVELGCPNDNTLLDPNSVEVTPSTIANKPVLVIKMPPVEAFAECIYVGIVAMIDINNAKQAMDPEILYFTLELGEAEHDVCCMFCQWQEATHYNLAELDKNISVEDFLLVITQRLGEQ